MCLIFTSGAMNRKLRTARNKCGCHNGKTSVVIIFDGLGSHDTRDTAAGCDKERNEALTGKSEMTEHTVHDECDTYHVSAVLKDGKH